MLLLIVEHFVYPVMPGPESSFVSSLLDLALPFTICYLLIFYIIFEVRVAPLQDSSAGGEGVRLARPLAPFVLGSCG